jgi:hypothetical protein
MAGIRFMVAPACRIRPISRNARRGALIDGSRAGVAEIIGLLREAISGRCLDGRQERRSLRNFSRKRPEATSLNHQYAIRRVFMCRR